MQIKDGHFLMEELEKVLFRLMDMQTLLRVKNSLLKKTQKIKWLHQFMLSTIRLMISSNAIVSDMALLSLGCFVTYSQN